MTRLSVLAALCLTAACSTVRENANSVNFAPVYPVEPVEETDALPSGAIFSGNAQGLFVSDRRAARVGDVLTVDFSENFRAQKKQSVVTARADSFGLDLPEVLPDILPIDIEDDALSAGAASGFSGTGNAAQSNSLRGRVTVTVVRILPGGLLEILGQKKLTLNNGDEYVRISGYLRPEDISAENVVSSDRIANAEIAYIGAGDVADAGKQGWLRRGLNTIAPF